MINDSTWKGTKTFQRIKNINWNLTAVGIIIALIVVYLTLVMVLFKLDIYTVREAGFWAAVGGALATIGLATAIYNQNYQNERLIRHHNKQSLILQESEWLPHFYPTYFEKFLACSGNKPWFPEFKAVVQGEVESDWYKQISYSYTEAQSPRAGIHLQSEYFDFDWFIDFPDGINDYFKRNVNSTTYGKMYFKFESMTGEWYFFIYQFKLEPDDDEYKIIETPEVQRLLPWKGTNQWEQLKSELSSSKSHSSDRNKMVSQDEFGEFK